MDKLVFFYIRPRVRNSDWVITFTHAKKEYVVNMKRWQCIFKASVFSELVNKDVKYFRKSLQRINDFYSKVDIGQKPYWYLISRLYYDDLIRMDNERIMKGEWKDNEGRANKSDESDKSKKEVKKKYGEFENVKLTNIEYEKLQKRFSDYLNKIESLSVYIKSKWDKYKDHYATIIARERKNKPPEPQTQEDYIKVFKEIWLVQFRKKYWQEKANEIMQIAI